MSHPIPIRLRDGRTLETWSEGPVEGRPLVFHHGTPGSGIPYGPFVAEAAARGLRLISYSRPGYGGSGRDEGRSVADCAADVVEVLDALGIDGAFVAGWSGGGPHALACAALLPERVWAAASVAGVGPARRDGLDFLAGMGRENVEELGAAFAGPGELRAWMEANAPGLAQVTGEAIVRLLGDLVSDVDVASVTPEFGAFLAEEIRHGLATDWWGWFDDDLAFVGDWGFDAEKVSVPVAVWQGRHDRMVPFAHGEWLAATVPGARAHLLDEHGHISLAVASFGTILDDLVEMATG